MLTKMGVLRTPAYELLEVLDGIALRNQSSYLFAGGARGGHWQIGAKLSASQQMWEHGKVSPYQRIVRSDHADELLELDGTPLVTDRESLGKPAIVRFGALAQTTFCPAAIFDRLHDLLTDGYLGPVYLCRIFRDRQSEIVLVESTLLDAFWGERGYHESSFTVSLQIDEAARGEPWRYRWLEDLLDQLAYEHVA
ncbi:MAG: hypothetical protein U0514_02320 [Candidatus Andersenbacteria bacterium]